MKAVSSLLFLFARVPMENVKNTNESRSCIVMKSQMAARKPSSREFSTTLGKAVNNPSWSMNCWLKIVPNALLLAASSLIGCNVRPQ